MSPATAHAVATLCAWLALFCWGVAIWVGLRRIREADKRRPPGFK
jgi:hypothetical protein